MIESAGYLAIYDVEKRVLVMTEAAEVYPPIKTEGGLKKYLTVGDYDICKCKDIADLEQADRRLGLLGFSRSYTTWGKMSKREIFLTLVEDCGAAPVPPLDKKAWGAYVVRWKERKRKKSEAANEKLRQKSARPPA